MQLNSDKISIEQLLKLKKHERPEAYFWHDFDESFERRKLKLLIRKDSTVLTVWRIIFKHILKFGPVLALVACTLLIGLKFEHSILNSNPSEIISSHTVSSAEVLHTSASSEFVQDTLQLSPSLLKATLSNQTFAFNNTHQRYSSGVSGIQLKVFSQIY